MGLSLIEKEIIIPGLKGNYRILHITDSHIVSITPEDADFIIDDGAHTGKQLSAFGKMRYNHFCKDGVSTTQRFAQLCDDICADPTCADVVVFTGDILDYYTKSGFSLMCEKLKQLPMPYMYVLGNHDMIFSGMSNEEVRKTFQRVCGENTEFQKYKLGELALIGIDNIRDCYSEKALTDLEEALRDEEHALLFQHIPLSTPEYHEYALSVSSIDYALGNDGVCVDDSWSVVYETIKKEDSKIRALICGDCHVEHESKIGNATQFTSPFAAAHPPVRFTIHG